MARVKITEAAFGADPDGFAKVLDGASVQINTSGGSAATVYAASSGGSTLTNPVTSDNGRIPGYLVEGSYSLVVTYDGVTADAVPFEARAAYPAGGTEGQVLTSDGAGSADWADPDEITASIPWTIDINVFAQAATNTNWSTLTATALYLMGGTRDSTAAQNAEVGWDVVLAAGTWTLWVMYVKDTDKGIITASLAGSDVGTIDMYDATSVANIQGTIAGITVAATGKQRLLFKMATKNASSSSYSAKIQHVRLLRTA